MDNLITSSTATSPLGNPSGQKCLKINDGIYAGKIALLYASTTGKITMATSEPPYDEFATPVDIITDSADTPFDATMDDDGNILIAYITDTANDLKFIRLNFSQGSWTADTPIIVYSSHDCSFPQIYKFSTGDLWLVFTRLDSGSYYLSVKSSSDNGDTWSPASDPGDTLTGGSALEIYGQMVESALNQFVFYSEGGSKIAYRSKPDGAVLWNSEVVLGSEGGYNAHFRAGVATDGKIGLAYVTGTNLKYREYSGSTWSSETILATSTITWPLVRFHEGEAYVMYANQLTSGIIEALYVHGQVGSFESARAADPRRTDLDKVLIYNSAAGTYQDKTDEAISSDTADVVHTSSNALLSSIGDAVYFGLSQPFNFIHAELSTSGAGGQVIWQYFDGQDWQTFTPYSGAWHFTASSRDVLLWQDYGNMPPDWQRATISGQDYYWIRAVTTAAYTTPPVGTRLTAISNLIAMIQGV